MPESLEPATSPYPPGLSFGPQDIANGHTSEHVQRENSLVPPCLPCGRVLVGETQGSRRLARPVLLALRASVCLSTHRVFSAFLCSLFHTGESAVKRFLPKSHLSKVIIQDNASVQRVQDIKLQHLENSKRKVGSMLDHMKKTFLHDQQKKMARWRKEYQHYQRMLEKIDQRAQAKEHRHSFSAPEAPKAPFGEWEEKTPGEAPPPKEKPASL
nr:PREDICTED: uncharacterized protein C5orf52 homolog [Anolis carolinensis]|eukprot:XP_016852547.1 PREDICTED: uncharacterized protein C5orf52 homolog [Anolis carolinensis]